MVWHAGRLLALEEGSPPIELDPDTLETRGRFDFAGRLPRNMTAHPKIDPVSGRMVFFANVPRGRLTGELVLYEADAAGELAWSCVVQGPYPALVHDFAITERFAILWICPLTLSEERAMSGRPLIAWEPDREVEIIVVPRGGRDEDALRFRGPACMAWHVMNAFDEGERIVLDLCEQAGAMLPSVDGTAPDPARAAQRLSRWELDLSRPGPVSRRALTDLICEYPRIDERRTGRPYRYGYVACLGGPGTGDLFHRGLARFDHETGEMAVWAADPGVAVGEPVFAPRPGGAEEEGWILSTLYDENTDRSCLAVFPAERLPAGPIARVRLDHRVPVGFHGLWRLFDA
jgi:carotenoid cleavage dioxygenase-like enzyme